MAKRDDRLSKFKGQSSNSMPTQLSPSPSRHKYRLQHKHKTEPGHFDDFVDTKVRGNFTPTPTEVTQSQLVERVAEKKTGLLIHMYSSMCDICSYTMKGIFLLLAPS